MAMDYDQILSFTGNILKQDLFRMSLEDLVSTQTYPNARHIKSEINAFKITNRYLRNIEQEYETFQIKNMKHIQSQGAVQ